MKPRLVALLALVLTLGVVAQDHRVILAEYYVDTDPGAGLATAMSATDGAFDQALEQALATTLSSASPGTHAVGVRMKGLDGAWSNTFRTVFYQNELLPARSLRVHQAEYFMDSDPGQGNATPMVAFDGNFDQALEEALVVGIPLDPGPHVIGVRILDASGTWSNTFRTVVFYNGLIPSRSVSMQLAEFYLDLDPGEGVATPLLAFDGDLDEALESVMTDQLTLSFGHHMLGVRVLGADGGWSNTFRSVIYQDGNNGARAPHIQQAEYFLGGDPGPGNATALLAEDGAFEETLEAAIGSTTAPTTSGAVVMGVRFRGADGAWSNTFRSVLYIQATASVNVSVEDELTFFDPNAPLVAGAHVVISDMNTMVVYADGFSNAAGVFSASNIPSGTHRITVSEPMHTTYQGTLVLNSGATLNISIFISRIAPADDDNDGYFTPQDCNDADPNINPGALEICSDGIDNDCDGAVDEVATYFADADADGFGDAAVDSLACSPPVGYVSNSTDQCPTDPNKTTPGSCGCGRPDADLNTNGVVDCLEDCDLDPTFNTADLGFGRGDGVSSGTVNVSVIQPDGKILIAGILISYNATPRNRVARLNSDGTLDNSFDPGTGANSTVSAMALQPDGKILIGGSFTTYNGTPRNFIARLNSDGSLDAGFNPGAGASAMVRAIALQPDGKILIGGDFNTINGVSRNRIARLNGDGSLDTGFIVGTGVGTGANDLVFSIALQPDGKAVIVGGFIAYNGTTRNRLARLNSDGSLDISFDPGAGASSTLNVVVLQTDGKILIGGGLTTFNGTSRRGIARVNSDGSLDTSFNPGTGATTQTSVLAIAVRADGKIRIGGNFTLYNGSARNRIAWLNSDGSLDGAFGPSAGANLSVMSIIDQPDGKTIIGGSFTEYNGLANGRVARLNSDSSLDSGFNPGSGANESVRAIAVQPDGKVVIGGDLLSYGRVLRSRIARMNVDGTADLGFNPGSGADGTVNAVAVQPDGKIVIGGSFLVINGTSRSRIGRLNNDGTYDTGFNTGIFSANGTVHAVVLQPDGKVLIGGAFSTYQSTSRNRVARLNSNSTNDTGFLPGTGANGTVRCMALQPDGKILIAGEFTTYNGTVRNRIARLNSNGSLDLTFDPGVGAGGTVLSMALRPDGRILIGGTFTTYTGTTRNRIARLNSDGSLDLGFDPGTGADNAVNTIAVQPDGRILLGGDFTSYNGTMRNRIARVMETGALDLGFFPGSGADATVSAIALQPDGQVLIVGSFTSYNGIGRNRVARIVACECPVGTSCNDNDPCTTNDLLGAECQCAGTLIDSDSDGTCDANDLCPGGPEPGTACNDNNTCTINDVIGTNCLCAGTFADADADGTCDANDLCPGGPETGAACNDNDACTSGDVIGSNCLCAGTFADADGDGTCDASDCAPNDPAVHPGATELCNGLDDNCNGSVDEGLSCGGCSPADIVLILANTQPTQACVQECYGSQLNDLVPCVTSCYVQAGYTEACATCVVEFQYCAAISCPACQTDPNSAACIQCRQAAGCDAAFMACSGLQDADGDGEFAPSDCDDNNAAVNHNGVEGCVVDGLDNDCDGLIDEDALVDADNDGFTLCTGDCNDTDNTIHPNATEVCDGADNDCDGSVDEGFPARYADNDGDGFGDPNNPSTCNDPSSTTDNTDCDDADATVYGGAPELCDGLDNDCNGTVDDNLAEDNDHDGFTPCTGDCDDQNATVFPGAPELCDGLDNDCNGAIEPQLYADVDQDGYGDAGNPVPCGTPGSSNQLDCDDTDPLITLAPQWFPDADGDGYGVYGVAVSACAQPTGYAGNSFDCNDNDAQVFPGQGCTECSPADLALLASNPGVSSPSQQCAVSCNSAQDPQQCLSDCLSDNGLSGACADCFAAYAYCLVATCPICQEQPESPACIACQANSGCKEAFMACSGLEDADNDGYFAPFDCNDNNASVHPDAAEACDGIDNDCDGVVDEGCDLRIAVKVLLDGPYDAATGLMNDGLRALGLVPTTEPYSGLGYTHVGGGGETTSPAVLAPGGSDAIVDWVLIELRAPSDPAMIVASRSALLQRDGDVVEVDGLSPVEFATAPGNYHVAVLHRNHLGCMTAGPVALSPTVASVDLTLGSTLTYGTEARRTNGALQLLWSGDVTFNGMVKYTGAGNDRDPILVTVGSTTPNNTVPNTYSTRDVNMDAQVKYTGSGNDRDPILVNVGSTTPNNVRVQQLP